MIRLLVALCAVIAFTPKEVAACQQRRDFDPWFALEFNSLPAIYERAATIDRVKIEARASSCVSRSDERNTCALNGEAIVVERLKGKSALRYSLARAPSDRRADNYGIDEISPRLPDGRLAFARSDLPTVQDIAAYGHRSNDFWDVPEIAPNGAQVGCTRHWELQPNLSYILFRRADGLAIAAEPIADESDMLLERLRLAKAGEPLMPSKSLQTYIGEASAIALLEHSTCPFRSSQRSRVVRFAGDSDAESLAYYATYWRPDAAGECATMRSLLVIGRDALPAMATIDRGMVARQGLLTGFRLTGPSKLSTDEAFKWLKAAQPSKSARRLSWRPSDGVTALFAFLFDTLANLLKRES